MRADTAAIGRVGDHEIVEASVGNEAKAVHQRVGAVVVQVHALHEQSPFALFHRRQFVRRKGAMFQRPRVTKMGDEARLDVVEIGEFEQVFARQAVPGCRESPGGSGAAFSASNDA